MDSELDDKSTVVGLLWAYREDVCAGYMSKVADKIVTELKGRAPLPVPLGFTRIFWSPDTEEQRDLIEYVDRNGMVHLFEVDRDEALGIDRWKKGGVALEDAAPTLLEEQVNAITTGRFEEN